MMMVMMAMARSWWRLVEPPCILAKLPTNLTRITRPGQPVMIIIMVLMITMISMMTMSIVSPSFRITRTRCMMMIIDCDFHDNHKVHICENSNFLEK